MLPDKITIKIQYLTVLWILLLTSTLYAADPQNTVKTQMDCDKLWSSEECEQGGPPLEKSYHLFNGGIQPFVDFSGNITQEINAGVYDLTLTGTSTWQAGIEVNTAARAGLTIEGRGNTVTVSSDAILGGFAIDNTNLSLTNIIFDRGSAPTENNMRGSALLIFNRNGITSNLNLAGTTFQNFSFANARNGVIRVAEGANVNIDGGDAGVTFQNNRGNSDGISVIALEVGNLTFTGNAFFNGNWSGNYGGAVALYDHGTTQNTLTFQDGATFTNNHAVVFGGAIDVFGRSARLIFNGETDFTGNYVFYEYATSTHTPDHVTDQHARAGALHIGYIESPNSNVPTTVTFNAPASFTGNYAVSTGQLATNRNGQGGAVGLYGNGGIRYYLLSFNDLATFSGNYAYGVTGEGQGGALYQYANGSVVNINAGARFYNNYASTYGGAIYLQEGTLNISASGDDVIFQGNRQGVTFNTNYQPDASSGTPNSIYLASSGTLTLSADADYQIGFYDPIARASTSTTTITKTGEGDLVFYGDNGTSGDSYITALAVATTIEEGYFTVKDGATYDSTGGSFTVESGATIRGGTGGELIVPSLSIVSGAALGATGGEFTVTSSDITMAGGSSLVGYGILTASSGINLTGNITANIIPGTEANQDNLTVNSVITGTGFGITKTGTGTLTMAAANTYTGATTVNAGTLATAIQNALQQSSAVTLASGTSFVLNNFDQTVNNLTGAGNIDLGSAQLTVNANTAGTLSGTVSGTGSLVKQGIADLTLSGSASNYSGGTTVSAGRLIATTGSALGTGDVAVATGAFVELALGSNGTLSNSFTGAGTLDKTGAGVATLTGTGSNIGTVNVNGGTLSLAQAGNFTAGTYTTNANATTALGADATLDITGVFTQAANSTLNVAANANAASITADSAVLDGTLNVSGLNFDSAASASALSRYTIISTTTGITNDFSNVNFSGIGTTPDYITFTGGKNGNDYVVGQYLTWYAGPTLGNGTFTVADGDTFNVDVALEDVAGSTVPWDGESLTKAGAGNLILSEVNTYTGDTHVNAGTLTLTAADSIADSRAVNVASGATVALGANQSLQDISGAGTLSLSAFILTALNNNDTTFSGNIAGTGSLDKTGTGTLTLSGTGNNYFGGTTISAGRLIALNAGVLSNGPVVNNSELELQFALAGTFRNALSGTGDLYKTGNGTATLTNAVSSGDVTVSGGALLLDQTTAFNVANYTTTSNAATTLNAGAILDVSGSFSQAANANLNVAVNANTPNITANTANLNGTLNVNGAVFADAASASELVRYTIINTTGGITNDFSTVNFLGATSDVDYITLNGGKNGNNYEVGQVLTWFAGTASGNGTFTVDGGSTFNVDVALSDEAAAATGWDGESLTKAGAGNLTLSEVNTYTGSTTVDGGTLSLAVADSIADSRDVTVNGGATVSLGANQSLNNLGGSGIVSLGSNQLTVVSNGDTTFGGLIQGTGALVKEGTESLTLSGANTYSGGTTIADGRLIASVAGAMGSGTVTNNSELEITGGTDYTLSNVLAGTTGTLYKTGSNDITVAAAGRSGTVLVEEGTLTFAQNGLFNAATYTTQNGAVTSVGSDSQLNVTGAYTQASGSTLMVELGDNTPIITAGNVNLAGTLEIDGFEDTIPQTASGLTSNRYTIIESGAAITTDFDSVTFGGAASTVDYLVLSGGVSSSGLTYDVGFELAWNAAPALASGTFTLEDETDTFNVDVVLEDRPGITSGWDGISLTKEGEGILVLSAQNTYTGDTNINEGTLQAGIDNAFADSRRVTVADSATLDLNDFDQTADNLTGAGTVDLGSADLTAVNNTTGTAFSGNITGSGSLIKDGASTLTLSGSSDYSGGTLVSAGRLIAQTGDALGTGTVTVDSELELNITADATMANQLAGGGDLYKTGSGALTLDNNSSSIGSVEVQAGNLIFGQDGTFTAGTYTTAGGAETTRGGQAHLAVTGLFEQQANATLNVVIGGTEPYITADSVALDGELLITNFMPEMAKASEMMASNRYTVISSSTAISGDFDSVDFGGVTTGVDYLILDGHVDAGDLTYSVGFDLTWFGQSAQGNGVFTMLDADQVFEVDVVLDDQDAYAPFNSGWDGRTLTKNGEGTLILGAQNTYTGSTLINGGTLSTTVDNAFADSEKVVVGSGATLALNGYGQTAQDLSGAGNITLGDAELTVVSHSDTEFSGVIAGDGSVVKDGTGTFTLSGNNTYAGGTTIEEGTLVATGGSALGTGDITNNADLELAFNTDSTLENGMTGSGDLTKTGAGTATLNGTSSSAGTVTVAEGTLAFEQDGTFTAGTYTTEDGAATTVGTDSQLVVNGTFTQEDGSTLNVGIGSLEPNILADVADIGGSLNIFDFTPSMPASVLTAEVHTVIEAAGGITGDFDSVDFGGAASSVDYLVLEGSKSEDNTQYNIGFGLTWYAGDELGNGRFTLANASDTFEVDVVLADQDPSATGWDGKTLTKEGDGTLILSAENTYTGDTVINGGTLSTMIANAFADSQNVTVADGATLALNGYDQTARNLSGAGEITLGDAALTVVSSDDTEFSGVIEGDGSLVKDGSGTFTLSGNNTYTGGTTIEEGTLVATTGTALGSGDVRNDSLLELAFSNDSTMANVITGSGDLTKTGTGTATLTGAGSSVNAVTVEEGTLALEQNGIFTSDTYTTESGAATTVGSTSQLIVNGAFTQQDGSTLNVGIGSYEPNISADTASIAGNLNISDFNAAMPASVLTAERHTILEAAGGIAGDFDSVDFGGVATGVDYLLFDAAKSDDNTQYTIGFELTWYAGPELGNGVFTLTDAANTFNVDVVLADQEASETGWNGKDLTKNGEGTLILSAENTYSGMTTVNGGTLSLEADTALGVTTALNVNGGRVVLNGTSQNVGALNTAGGALVDLDGGMLTLTDSQRTAGVTDGGTISGGTLSGDGTLIVDTSDLNITGANTGLTADVTLQGGSTVTMADASGLGSAGGLTLTAQEDTVAINGSGTFGKDVTGVGTLSTSSGADITVTGNNREFTGTFDINSGSNVTVTAGSGVGSADVELDGTLTARADADWTLSNTITGTGALVKEGEAALTIGTPLNYTGATTVNAGTLTMGAENVIADSRRVVVNEAGTIALNGYDQIFQNLSGSGTIDLETAVMTVASSEDTIFSGTLEGEGGIAKTGTAAFTVDSDNVTLDTVAAYNGTLDFTGALETSAITFDPAAGDTAEITIDTLRFSGDRHLEFTVVGGEISPAAVGGTSLFSYNTLEVSGRNNSVSAQFPGDAQSGDTLRFIMPGDITSEDVMLDTSAMTANGYLNIDGKTLDLSVDGEITRLNSGDNVTLISNTSGLLENNDEEYAVNYGMSTYYFQRNDDDSALILGYDGRSTRDESKVLLEGHAARLITTTQSSLLVGTEGSRILSETADHGTGLLAAMEFGKENVDTGSRVSVNSFNVMAGPAWRVPTQAGDMRVGVFAEAGVGDYDTYNRFASGSIRGSGDTQHYGGGVLLRHDFFSGLYLDVSARAGAVYNDYKSRDLGNAATYDTSSFYFGAHAGGGYVAHINPRSTLDTYAKVFWTHEDGDSATTKEGDRVRLDDADSVILRAGVRYNYEFHRGREVFGGLAWEHEFDGKINGTLNGDSIDSVSLGGSSGFAEIGVGLDIPDTGWHVNISGNGKFGTREAIGGTISIGYSF